jgi:hypothetical protein
MPGASVKPSSATEQANNAASAMSEIRTRLVRSATWPANRATPMNGTASARPISPSDKGSWVRS